MHQERRKCARHLFEVDEASSREPVMEVMAPIKSWKDTEGSNNPARIVNNNLQC